jgi:hypothetical protein
MNHKTGKFIAAILIAAMLVSLTISCADKSSTDGKVADTTAQAETTAAETEIKPDLPSDLDYQGEAINIWYFTKNSDVSESFINIQGALDGDVVNEALYYRNLNVEETLNVDLVFTDNGVASSDVGTSIRKIIMSGSNDYDIYNVVQWNSAKFVTEGLYYNLIDLPYVDIDKPWWSTYYINEINIGKNNRYFLCGDISIDMIRCISCMYFNKVIYQDSNGDPNTLYNTVLEGGWTLDKLYTLAEQAYSDLNGNEKADDGDQFGLFSNNYNNIDVLFYGAGLHATTRDESGIPSLTLNNENTINAMDKIYKLCYENKGVKLRADGKGTLQDTVDFNNGYGLFLMGFLYSSEQLRDMKQDYGIIPSPKYDETQKNYSAVVHDIATLICLPNTCTKLEECGAVLELMAYQSYKTVTPAYYETAMKTKYTRDQLSSQIIDILHDNNMTDIAYVFGDAFNGLGYIGRNMIINKKADFASYYAKNEKAALKTMQKLIDAYEELQK